MTSHKKKARPVAARVKTSKAARRPAREPDCCRRLEAQVRALARKVDALQQSPPGASAMSLLSAKAPAPLSVLGSKGALGTLVDVGLQKSADSPDLVRISLDNDHSVVFLPPGRSKGVIPQVAVGTFVVVQIEVAGNPGDTATVTVSRAVPNIKVTVPDTGRISETQSLFVVG